VQLLAFIMKVQLSKLVFHLLSAPDCAAGFDNNSAGDFFSAAVLPKPVHTCKAMFYYKSHRMHVCAAALNGCWMMQASAEQLCKSWQQTRCSLCTLSTADVALHAAFCLRTGEQDCCQQPAVWVQGTLIAKHSTPESPIITLGWREARAVARNSTCA
jgi:hypothetical protein